MNKNICISGYYGFDNFGDETILKVLTENLKQLERSANITVFSSNPTKTKALYNVDSVKSFDIVNVIKTILKSDCLISGGGSLLQDVTSKKSLIYYLAIISMALFFRKKTVIFAQGIGPINNKFLEKITKSILKQVNYISVRDAKSYNLLNSWNIKSELCSDPVWNISVNNKKTNTVGIQLRNSNNLNELFIKNLAESIKKYYKDKEIIIISLQNDIDLEICNKLKSYLTDLNVKVVENNSNEKILEIISKLDTLIAMRYHACLVAIKNNVKLLPINYDIKVEELSKEFDLNYLELNNETDNTIENFINKEIQYNQEKINNHKFNFEKIKPFL